MNVTSRLAVVLMPAVLCLPACHPHHSGHAHGEHHTIVVTSPQVRDVTVTQQYVGQIHSRRHISVRALEGGYLEPIPIREGQTVRAGDLLFTVIPTLYKARLDAEVAEAKLAQLEVNNTQRLVDQNVVSVNELALQQAKLAKAQAKVKLAEAELNFTKVTAPFDGIVDRLHEQHGSLVKEGDVLTTLSDNTVMWVYFNVPETRYLEYMNELAKKVKQAKGNDERASKLISKGESKDDDDDDKEKRDRDGKKKGSQKAESKHDDDDDKEMKGSQEIELVLADGSKFSRTGKIGAIEAKFNNETGNIPFRADFPNADGLLRHGQTGNVLIHRTLKGAVVIPQRATFEILDKRYVFVVGPDGVVKQREITVQHEQDDIFLVGQGLAADERFVLEGVRQVKDGERVECEYRKPEDALANQKHHAE